MKILIMCPGSFIHQGVMTGLYSPERGEGRWSQQVAYMLAMAGHEVFAASGGLGDPQEHLGVRLLDQGRVKEFEPYDLFIESAWWDNKEIPVKAKKYVALKWSLEDYLRKPFPEDFFLAYPYPSHHWKFSNFANSDKTFALPAMFEFKAQAPNWDSPKVFLPGKIDKTRGHEKYMSAIIEFLKKYPVEGCSKSYFQEEFGDQIDFNKEGSVWWENESYNKVIGSIMRCRMSLPILNPGAIIETTLQGVPPVFWEHGGFFNDIGRELDINIPHDAPSERFTYVAERLMNDRKTHAEVVLTLQAYFSCHVYENAIKYFDHMVKEIF